MTDNLHAPAERWQHGQGRGLEGGRETVAKPVQALLRSKRIGDAEVVAAERFYRAWAFGMEGARNHEMTDGPSGSPSPDAAMVARMDAAWDYSSAARALDMPTMALLFAVVLDERSIVAIAGRPSGKAVTNVAERAADALKALADHYSRADGSRRGYKNA